MNQPTLLTGQVYAVEVPEGMNAFKIECRPGINFYALDCYQLGEYDEPTREDMIDLPAGNWEYLGTTEEVTEDIAKAIVQVFSNGKISGSPQYRRYDRDPVKDTPAKCWTRDSRHALETLLTSKGLDTTKNYVLIKKLP